MGSEPYKKLKQENNLLKKLLEVVWTENECRKEMSYAYTPTEETVLTGLESKTRAIVSIFFLQTLARRQPVLFP
jgi:hypothetical protein